MAGPKIAIVYYSMYGHIKQLVRLELSSQPHQDAPANNHNRPKPRRRALRRLAEPPSYSSTFITHQETFQSSSGTDLLPRVEETLPQEVLGKMHAPAKPADVETISDPTTLEEFDGFLFGIPTRYGNFPAQWKTFLVSNAPVRTTHGTLLTSYFNI
jgi:NAD(P)H dehydrogenase (quinone)